MSEDVLTSESPWPELAELDGFWDTDVTPPRGIPRVDVDGGYEDDDPTPVNAPRPVLPQALPPPTTPAVAGPAPTGRAHLPGLPTGALLPQPPSPTTSPPSHRWPRRIAAVLVAGGLVAGGVYVWQWNEARHDAATAAHILPSQPVETPDVTLIEVQRGPRLDISISADLESGDALAAVRGGPSIALADDQFWTRATSTDRWTPASSTFLERNSTVVGLVGNASLVTVTDVFPAAVHPYLDVVDDRSASDPGIALEGPTVLEVDGDGAVRKLTLRVDRNGVTSDEPLLARRLRLSGAEPVDVVLLLHRTGIVLEVSAPAGVTSTGGDYRLVAAATAGPGPLDDLDPGTFETTPPSDG